ncbi:hypothetical protein L596_025000 [Steinernema carpocapsae]|uniref:Uncharacterized protein n=1 Tax=Steinernema carpocapsae TaxID=34508 RepID=A0A4U5M6J9_STECR|nr:hypothetical protein L596_025000 [Steinernema carpocapsae]
MNGRVYSTNPADRFTVITVALLCERGDGRLGERYADEFRSSSKNIEQVFNLEVSQNDLRRKLRGERQCLKPQLLAQTLPTCSKRWVNLSTHI